MAGNVLSARIDFVVNPPRRFKEIKLFMVLLTRFQIDTLIYLIEIRKHVSEAKNKREGRGIMGIRAAVVTYFFHILCPFLLQSDVSY